MAPMKTIRNIMMELRKTCQHPYLSAPELDADDISPLAQHKALTEASGKLNFLRLLLPKLKERGHRVLLFSQFKIALNIIEDFLVGEGYKFLRLDGDVQQAQRQKSMDAFNAPDSDYFIFLLTTRAGGVGINLATADTVIVYDPDFNPHMDLQAIARAHRYGQKKATLVFKLMTKNSVEEQIVLKGKKKMVLDHLVVQQMGKENEEGDIENMLLHGAAALYDTNADGHSASDIRYTSKDVDELIDKVEADAIAEAKALEDRDKSQGQEPDAVTEGQGPAKPKESMSFAFAKIWEADQSRLHEMSDDEEEGNGADEDAWLQAWENDKKEKEAKLLAERGQRLRQRQANTAKYPADGPFSDDHSDEQLERIKGKKDKGKGKMRQNGASDEDWAMNPEENSESDDDYSTLVADGLDIFDVIDGKAVPKPIKSPATAEEAAARAKAKDALQKAIKDGTVPTLSAEDVAAKQARKAARAERRAKKEAAKAGASQSVGTGVSNGQSTGIAVPSVPLMVKRTSSKRTSGSEKLKAAREMARVQMASMRRPSPNAIQGAQRVVQWLYHVLSNLGFKTDLDAWARMALVEVPPAERSNIYAVLARKADYEMMSRGQQQYFSSPGISSTVELLFSGGYDVLGDEERAGTAVMPDVPGSLGKSSYSSPPGPRVAQPSQPVQSAQKPGHGPSTSAQYSKHLPSPYSSPRNGHMAAPALQDPAGHVSSRNPSAPAGVVNGSSRTPPTVHHQAQAGPSRQSDQFAPNSIAQIQAPNGHHSDALDGLLSSMSDLCYICQGDHALTECRMITGISDLSRLRSEVWGRQHPNENKTFALNKIEDAIRSYKDQAYSRSVQADAHATKPNGNKRSRQSEPQTQVDKANEIIVIDDDETEDEGPPTKIPRKDVSTTSVVAPETSAVASSGCVICGSNKTHGPKRCPVIKAGPESIKLALRRFQPKDPIWKWLKTLYDQVAPPPQAVSTSGHVCAFCSQVCGKTIRECATDMHKSSFAGRKALKARIRDVESLNEKTGGSAKDMANELFDVYLKWEK